MIRLATATRILDAPIGAVWAVTSSFGTIQAWIPGISAVSIAGAGVGAVRSVIWQGVSVDERLVEVDAARHRMRYTVEAAVLEGIGGLHGSTELTAIDAHRTRIDWIAEAATADGDVAPIIAMLADFNAASIAGLAAFLKVDSRPLPDGAPPTAP